MDFLTQTRFIERLQFFNGQRLFATDLQGLEAFNREMRWLHNKSLHQPGIGNGLAVSGRKGDREVNIGPGYAIDAEGREIVLTENVVEPVPPVAGEEDGSPVLFDLTISYPDDAFLEESERREGICRHPGGTIRLQEKPIFCWVRLKENGQPIDNQLKVEIAAGMRIVLARAEVLNCQLNKDISIAQRLSARPAKQPYVCCETAEPAWQPWVLVEFEPDRLVAARDTSALAAASFSRLGFCPYILPIGLQAVIDTSECGFLTTPCYSARISGPRIKQITSQSGAGQSIAVVSATVTSTGGTALVLTVNNAGSFRVGDFVTENNVSGATITQIGANNQLTLSEELPGLSVGDTLRIANIPPSQATFRMTSVTGLQGNGKALMRGIDTAGNKASESVVIQSVNTENNTVTLAATPARTHTYDMSGDAANAPVLIPEQTIPAIVDGLVQIVDPLPNKFTLQVLLLLQLLTPGRADADEINLAVLTGGRAAKRQAARRQASNQEEEVLRFIQNNFSDWHLVWMGVEG